MWYNIRHYGNEKESVQGRDRRDARPGGQLALLEEGDLPAGAHIQRLRRNRPRQVPRAHRQGPTGRQPGVEDPDRRRPRGQDADGVRQRHRHGRGGPRGQPRHHRPLRHEEVPRDAQGEGGIPRRRSRSREAVARGVRVPPRADRPVRRRVLRGVHGGRQGNCRDAQARHRDPAQVGVRHVRRLHYLRRRPGLPRDVRDAPPARRPALLPRLVDGPGPREEVLGLHRLPDLLPRDRQGDPVAGRREGREGGRGGQDAPRGARG